MSLAELSEQALGPLPFANLPREQGNEDADEADANQQARGDEPDDVSVTERSQDAGPDGDQRGQQASLDQSGGLEPEDLADQRRIERQGHGNAAGNQHPAGAKRQLRRDICHGAAVRRDALDAPVKHAAGDHQKGERNGLWEGPDRRVGCGASPDEDDESDGQPNQRLGRPDLLHLFAPPPGLWSVGQWPKVHD